MDMQALQEVLNSQFLGNTLRSYLSPLWSSSVFSAACDCQSDHHAALEGPREENDERL